MGSRDLRVDPDGVHAAGATLGTAPGTATPAVPAVTPCAADAASVGVAADLASQIAAVNTSTVSRNLRAGSSSVRLHFSAEAYAQQEASSAAGLAGTAAWVGPAVMMRDAPSAALPAAVPASPTPGGGVVPATGRQASELIHGGPGPAGLQSAAAMLESTAEGLDQAAATVRAARSETEHSWDSDAAEQASDQLIRLESDFIRTATHARTIAQQARNQVDNFQRATAEIPPPSLFDDLQRRLMVANAANAQPGSLGRYAPVIAALQQELAAAHQRAMSGFGKYLAGAKIDVPDLGSDQTPATGGADGGDDKSPQRPGSGTRQHAPSTDPLGDPLTDPGVGGAPQAATELMATVVPAVAGLVSGAAGGVLGALSGAGQTLSQLGNQTLGGLVQGANAALASAPRPAGPPKDSNSSAAPGDPDMPGLDDAGGAGADDGGGGGGTEPAGASDVPLAAPAGTSAPPEAAPATFSASPAAAPEPAAAGGPSPGGAMMGAPFGGRGAAGGGEDDRRLYPERRLRIETPPNTEPVKGRREARRSRSEKSGEADGGR